MAIEMVIQSPDLYGCAITREAINNAFEIYGSDVAAVKGKTRRSQPTNGQVQAPNAAEPIGVQDLYSGVMFIRNQPHLLTVVHPLDLTVCTALSSQSAQELLAGVTEQIAQLLASGVHCGWIDIHPCCRYPERSEQ